MRTALKALFIAVLLVVGFGAGLGVGILFDNFGLDISADEREQADKAADLQRRVIEELQGRYYREVDAGELGTAGVDGVLDSLEDPYTVYLDPQEAQALREQTEGRYTGIGASLQKNDDGTLLITGVFAGSPAKQAGLLAGDVILAVDGVSTTERSLEENIAHIKGEEGTDVKLRIERENGQKKTFTVTRREITIPITEKKMLTAPDDTKVGYIWLTDYAEKAADKVREAIEWSETRKARWIVFDLRSNGGGLLDQAVDVSSLFIEKGAIVSTEGLHSPKEVYDATGDVATDLPLVVLVDGFTASASEITAGAIQDYERGTLIGTRTFGKGLVQSIVSMPEGAVLKLTTAVYLTPDGRDINDLGIKPDITVKDKPKQKGDEQLDAALEYIAGQE